MTSARWLHSEQSAWWNEERATWPHHDASFFVEAAGLRWHVQRMGSGPPIVLVHGTGASTHSWRDVMPLLARRYTVIAMDLPGHAFTEPLSSARTSIEGIGHALAALLQCLHVEPVCCVGHSAGAVILCEMVLRRRIEPRAILSINGAFLPLGGTASVLFAPLARLLAGAPGIARLLAPRPGKARATVSQLIARTGSTLDEAGVELYCRLVRRPSHVAGALRMMGNWKLQDFQNDLPALPVPLTLLVGSNDLMVPPRQAFAVQKLAGRAVVRCLQGLGHLAHEERPGLIAEEIAALCGQP